MHVECMWNACGMHVECMWNACGMHVECMWNVWHAWLIRGVPWNACGMLGMHVECLECMWNAWNACGMLGMLGMLGIEKVMKGANRRNGTGSIRTRPNRTRQNRKKTEEPKQRKGERRRAWQENETKGVNSQNNRARGSEKRNQSKGKGYEEERGKKTKRKELTHKTVERAVARRQWCAHAVETGRVRIIRTRPNISDASDLQGNRTRHPPPQPVAPGPPGPAHPCWTPKKPTETSFHKRSQFEGGFSWASRRACTQWTPSTPSAPPDPPAPPPVVVLCPPPSRPHANSALLTALCAPPKPSFLGLCQFFDRGVDGRFLTGSLPAQPEGVFLRLWQICDFYHLARVSFASSLAPPPSPPAYPGPVHPCWTPKSGSKQHLSANGRLSR
eukprot:gene7673-biopygen18062